LFPQDLLKKLSEILSLDKIKNSVEDNYSTILKMIFAIGGILVLFVGLIAFIVGKSAPPTVDMNEVKRKAKVEEEKRVKVDDTIIINNEFVYPPIASFDLSNDYIELMPIKKFKVNDFKSTINYYDIIAKEDFEESLKFNFEKRGGK